MRRRHRRITGPQDLDITAFMNLMIVLVPVLLMNMVFSQTSILELNFPSGADSSQAEEQLQLRVLVQPDQLLVSDSQGGLIKAVPMADGEHDFETLQMVMRELKARLPDKRDITLMPMPDTSYQTLVTLMDKVRSFKTVVAGSVVNAELFPDISIADAPDLSAVKEGA